MNVLAMIQNATTIFFQDLSSSFIDFLKPPMAGNDTRSGISCFLKHHRMASRDTLAYSCKNSCTASSDPQPVSSSVRHFVPPYCFRHSVSESFQKFRICVHAMVVVSICRGSPNMSIKLPMTYMYILKGITEQPRLQCK